MLIVETGALPETFGGLVNYTVCSMYQLENFAYRRSPLLHPSRDGVRKDIKMVPWRPGGGHAT